MARLMRISDPDDGHVVDRGLCLYFRAPHSFTGEDMGELQVHGGRAVVAALLRLMARMPGMRPAEPGEFTRRAFVNGKLDLVEVEALVDVIDAETEGQLRLAQRLAGGGLSRRVESWRRELLSVMALVEAVIDFSDEADVAADSDRWVMERSAGVLAEIEGVLDDGGCGERLRDGVSIVIAGPPNAGKSTSLNLLSRRDAAIVSAFPGTTRDPIEVQLDLGGIPVTLVDTAGLREVGDVVEAMGVERARERVAATSCSGSSRSGRMARIGPRGGLMRVRTKPTSRCSAPEGLAISALTGAGITDLLDAGPSRRRACWRRGERPDWRERQRARFRLRVRAAGAVRLHGRRRGRSSSGRSVCVWRSGPGARDGAVDVEEILGEIFAGFCIGK